MPSAPKRWRERLPRIRFDLAFYPSCPLVIRPWQTIGLSGAEAKGQKLTHRAVAPFTLFETTKLNGVDPQAYLAEALERIADHPINQIEALLLRNVALS